MKSRVIRKCRYSGFHGGYHTSMGAHVDTQNIYFDIIIGAIQKNWRAADKPNAAGCRRPEIMPRKQEGG